MPGTTIWQVSISRVRLPSSSTERRRASPARRRRIIRTGPSAGRRSRPRAPSARLAILNPKTMEQPWERIAPSRLNPVMTLVDPRFNDLAGMKFAANVNPASAERLFAGSGRAFADLIAIAAERKPLPRFCTAGDAARPRHARVDTDCLGQRGRAAPGQRCRAGARACRPDRPPRSRRGRSRGQRRSHLQRRHGQCRRGSRR